MFVEISAHFYFLSVFHFHWLESWKVWIVTGFNTLVNLPGYGNPLVSNRIGCEVFVSSYIWVFGYLIIFLYLVYLKQNHGLLKRSFVWCPFSFQLNIGKIIIFQLRKFYFALLNIVLSIFFFYFYFSASTYPYQSISSQFFCPLHYTELKANVSSLVRLWES